jgi:hypothetical protein
MAEILKMDGTPATPPAALTVRDAFGRALAVGDEVILRNALAPSAVLLEMTPILHPQAPPNLIAVTFQITLQLQVSGLRPVGEFVLARTLAEREAHLATLTPPPAGDRS